MPWCSVIIFSQTIHTTHNSSASKNFDTPSGQYDPILSLDPINLTVYEEEAEPWTTIKQQLVKENDKDKSVIINSSELQLICLKVRN